MERAPQEVDPREFRNALGRFASGITIVTTAQEGAIHGMTANAFVSVSLDPPLVLVAADQRTTWHEKTLQSGRYGVSILSEKQGDLSNHFAGRSSKDIEVPFLWRHETPLIEGAIAHFVCRVVNTHLAGDHTLHIGQVEYLNYKDGKPLPFYAGEYGALKVEDVNVWEHSFWW